MLMLHLLLDKYLPVYVQGGFLVELPPAVVEASCAERVQQDWATRFRADVLVCSSGSAARLDEVHAALEAWWAEEEEGAAPSKKAAKRVLAPVIGPCTKNLGKRHDQKAGWRDWAIREAARSKYLPRPRTPFTVAGGGRAGGTVR